MSTRTQIEQLATFAGMQLSHDTKAGQWKLYRGGELVHRTVELSDMEGFLSSWVAHVRS